MSYRDMERRLAELEAQADAEYQRWLEGLTDDELDALIATFPPDPELEAAVRVLSSNDLDRAIRGDLSTEDILRMYRAGHADAT